MAELDEKINALLSDPDSMAKIMQLAQSLSGSSGSSESQQAPQGPWSASSPPPSPQQAAPAFSPAGSGGGGGPMWTRTPLRDSPSPVRCRSATFREISTA